MVNLVWDPNPAIDPTAPDRDLEVKGVAGIAVGSSSITYTYHSYIAQGCGRNLYHLGLYHLGRVGEEAARNNRAKTQKAPGVGPWVGREF